MELLLASGFLSLLLLVWLPAEPAKFEICLENLTVDVKCHKLEGQKVGNQIYTVIPGENCTDLTTADMLKNCTAICYYSFFITGINSTDTGNSIQETNPSCNSSGPENNVTGEKNILTRLNLLGITLGLALATLFYMPIIGLLLWQRKRNRTGKLTSREVAERNQLSRAASVTGTEDLTYANLTFEKKGTKPASSVIYTEIKPSQQNQSGGDAGAASTEKDTCTKRKGK